MTTRVRDPQTDPRGPGRHPPVPDLPREAWYQEAWYAIAGRPEFKYKIFRDYVKAAKLRGQWQEWNIRDIVKHEEQNTNTYIPDSDPGLPYNFARELRDDWRPAQIDVERLLGFKEHPGELENVFFETHWKNLYAKTLQFAEKWFGNDIDFTRIEGCENIWDRQSIFTPQFIEYAKLVGHEDRIRGSWAALLNDPRQRKWLITGILGVVMERKIFDQLLFGAEPELRSELERADDMYLQEEGFSRKIHRSQIVRFGLKHHLVPRDFWVDIDSLTAATAKIFLPFLNVMKIFATNIAGDDKTLRVFMQELHFILGYAGILQVSMAQDESIFLFTSATPGAFFDSSTEYQSDVVLYRESRDFYIAREKLWEEQAVLSMRNEVVNNAYGFKLPKNEIEARTIRAERRRGAKVKIAVFPKVTRFIAVNKGMGQVVIEDANLDEDQFAEEMYWAEGTKSVDIHGACVVYYQGLLKPGPGIVESITLEQALDRVEMEYNGSIHFIAYNASQLFKFLLKQLYRLALLAPVWTVLFCIYVGWDYLLLLLGRGFAFFIPFLLFAEWAAYKQVVNDSVMSGVFVSIIPFLFVGLIGYISGDDYESYNPWLLTRNAVQSIWAN